MDDSGDQLVVRQTRDTKGRPPKHEAARGVELPTVDVIEELLQCAGVKSARAGGPEVLQVDIDALAAANAVKVKRQLQPKHEGVIRNRAIEISSLRPQPEQRFVLARGIAQRALDNAKGCMGGNHCRHSDGLNRLLLRQTASGNRVDVDSIASVILVPADTLRDVVGHWAFPAAATVVRYGIPAAVAQLRLQLPNTVA